MTEHKCPGCGENTTDDWPIYVNGEVVEGGCLVCWEKECWTCRDENGDVYG